METLITNEISHSARRVFQYVLNDLQQRLPSHITYHNMRHTLDVVDSCKSYINKYEIDRENEEMLLIAAAAHDYGFVISPENHEATSANMVTRIMQDNGYNLDSLSKVRGLIMATKLPQSPNNILEQIIADADLDYLGRPDYPEISEAFYRELQHFNKINTIEQWYDLQIGFLENHTYFTDWARENRDLGKRERIQILKEERSRL